MDKEIIDGLLQFTETSQEENQAIFTVNEEHIENINIFKTNINS